MLFAVVGALIFTLGVAGTILAANLLRRILAFNLMGSGAFLVLVGLAQRGGESDPVPHAMVLTGIGVAVAATALALALLRKQHEMKDSEEELTEIDDG
jgi:multicomponent Na+:H+ antiporter subunit C